MEQLLLKATKEKKLWRTVITYFLTGHGTEKSVSKSILILNFLKSVKTKKKIIQIKLAI